MSTTTLPTTWADAQALEPDTTFDAGKRRVTTEWMLASREIEHRGRLAVECIVITLTTHHYGKAEYAGRPDRVYRSVLTWEKRTRDGMWVTTSFGVYSQQSAVVLQEDAPRYSAGQIQRHHLAALRVMEREFSHCVPVFAEAHAEVRS